MVDIQIRYGDTSTPLDFNQDDLNGIVAITYQVGDITNLNQINASYSKNFQLPATKRNNEAFGYVYDPNNPSFNSLKEPSSCEITVDGIEIIRGKANVQKSLKTDIANAYDFSIIGDNYEAYNRLKDIQVSGLGFGTFTLNQPNIENSWNYTAASGNVVFAPIDFGNMQADGYWLNELVPSFFVANILASGFSSAGLAYESNWLQTEYAQRLVLPFNGIWELTDADFATVQTKTNFTASQASINITAGSGKQYFNITESTSNPHYNNAGSTFIANVPAVSNFYLELRVQFPVTIYSPNDSVVIGVEVNGATVKQYQVNRSASLGLHVIDVGELTLNAADIVKPFIIADVFNVQLLQVVYTSTAKRKILDGTTITLANYVPIKKDGLTVWDVLKGLAEMYNLQFYYDSSKNLLKFEPFDTFYSGELDWSTKWNQSQNAELSYFGDVLNQEILHKYKDDGTDYWLDRWDNGYEFREPYASYLHELPRNYVKGRKVIENSLFAPTIDFENEQFGETIPSIRWNTKDGTQFSGGRSGMIPEVRILYYEGKNTNGTFKMYVANPLIFTYNTYSFLPRLAFRAATTDSWQSLAYDTWASNSDGLFKTYFESKYRLIHNGITAIYPINLTVTDIANRPLDKKIWLDNAWWIINKIIDFNPIDDAPTMVELMKITDLTFTIGQTTSKWIGITRGTVGDPISKPVSDWQQTNGVIVGSGEQIGQIFNSYTGAVMGSDNEVAKNSSSFAMGQGLISHYENQTLFGTYNELTPSGLLIVGDGTNNEGRQNAMAVTRDETDGYKMTLGADNRVLTDQYHLTTSGVKRSSYKVFTGSGTTAGDGTFTVYPTMDGTISGGLIFNEITYASAMIISSSPPAGIGFHINAITLSGVSFHANTAGTFDFIYKIEGN